MGELVDYIECNIRDNREIIFMGDFNIHLNKANDHDTITFNEFVESFGLCDRVTCHTHRLENTIDLIITAEQ